MPSVPEPGETVAGPSPETMAETGPALGLATVIHRMTALARAGEWQQVQGAADKIRALLEQLPLAQRQAALAATSAGIDSVSTLALVARNEVGEKLSAVRRGRDAAASYRTTGMFRDLR